MILSNIMEYKGRLNRQKYWTFILYVFALAIAAMFVMTVLLDLFPSGYFYGAGPYKVSWNSSSNVIILIVLITVISISSATVRRLHDVGKSGLWALISLSLLLISLATIIFRLNFDYPLFSFSIALGYIISLTLLIRLLAMPSERHDNLYGPACDGREGRN